MQLKMRASLLATGCAIAMLSLFTLMPASAGQTLLSVNSGTTSEDFVIQGERSLVMNGFDLTPLSITLPATIDKVSIDVVSPVAGAQTTVVVYQDPNGGSPVDAQLLTRTSLEITGTGTVTIPLTTPATVTAPVVWVGLYLPVGFRFNADQSGSSVLTYWAWTPGSEFDLATLSSAGVLGPADGTAPVNLNLNGKARITAEITGANAAVITGTPGTPIAYQVAPVQGETANFGVMRTLTECSSVLYDTADVAAGYNNQISVACKQIESWRAPAVPAGYRVGAMINDVILFDQGGIAIANEIPVAITHCVVPAEADLARAVVGVAYGVPRSWRILPTQRYGNTVCAEVPAAAYVAYFVPTT